MNIKETGNCRKKNELLIVQRKKNNCIEVITNHDVLHPLTRVKRWSRTVKNVWHKSFFLE